MVQEEFPLVKISAHKNRRRSVNIYINSLAMGILQLNKILFFEKDLIIKETTINTHKPITIRRNQFTFTPKVKDPDDLIGNYTINKIDSSRFELNFII